MKNSLFSAALCMAVIPAAATATALDLTPDRVSILGLSYHGIRDGYTTPTGQRRNWNETNPGLALSYQIDGIHALTAAVFLNSFDHFGAAVTMDQVWFRGDNWNAGLYSGLVYYPTYGSYQQTNYGHIDPALDDVFLVGGFRVEYGHLELRYSPSDGEASSFLSMALVFQTSPKQPDLSVGAVIRNRVFAREF